ncbi:hypothetical protein F5I97DRAFT_520274 [Phlebopus sp. FC_14]|nr:hypothetical protein F5I97DRAFT_520274 [Phlebopus sp. FC_14]
MRSGHVPHDYLSTWVLLLFLDLFEVNINADQMPFAVVDGRVVDSTEPTTGSSNQWLADPRPDYLRALVLDYLCHNCYSKTAKTFAKDSAVRHLDKDGDEVVLERDSERQRLRGTSAYLSDDASQVMLLRERRVEEAMTLLNDHFPKVLADDDYESDAGSVATQDWSEEKVQYTTGTVNPTHLSLNLRILAFIEACRTVPLVYSHPHCRRATSPVLSKPPEDAQDGDKHQVELLIRAQKLYASVNLLRKPEDRSTYLKELSNVGGLLAYKVPENSPMAKYLHQERRDRVADQINRSTNMPTVSYLELAVRDTHALWAELQKLRFKIPLNSHRPAGVKLPPSVKSQNASGSEKDTSYEAPPFDLQLFLDAKA